MHELPRLPHDTILVTAEVAKDAGVNQLGMVAQHDAKTLLSSTPDSQAAATSAAKSTVSPLASLWTSFYAPPGGAYGSWYQRTYSLSAPSNGEHSYIWYISPGSNTQVCGQGMGWYRKYDVGGVLVGIYEKAYGLGCGSNNGADVPWQGVSAYPKFRAKSINLTGGSGLFQ